VLDKPAGITVVGGRGVPRPTLLDLAVERWADARPVHRLDKPTSGCTVVAKTAFGQQALSDAFRRHLVDKRYLALVHGVPSWEALSIDARLARVDDPDLPRIAGKKTLAIQTIDDAHGVRALTRVKVLARGDGVSLVEARPETGRMHQIRCHLSHVGFPLVGDVLYGGPAGFVDGQDVALHALCVSFPRPEGGRAFVTTRPPSSWARWCGDHGVAFSAVDEARARFLKPLEKIAAEAPTKKPAASPSKPSSSKPPKKTGWAKAKPRTDRKGARPTSGSKPSRPSKPAKPAKPSRRR
jgi:RluA family pseudouridine synthase